MLSIDLRHFHFRIVSIAFIIFYSFGCFTMFERKEVSKGQFRLKNGDIINVITSSSGATSSDMIWIYKINEKKEKIVVDSIDRLGTIYKTSFLQINDTLLNIIFEDTVVFKGRQFERLVILKNRVILK